MSVATGSIIGATALAGAGASGAFGGGGGGASSPNPTNVGNQYLALLQAFAQGAPTQLNLQEQYGPQYTQQGLQQLYQQMLGTGSQPGYLNLYGSDVVPAISSAANAANASAAGANVGRVATMGPGAVSAVEASNPAEAGLLNTLTSTAQGQLNLGTQVDPATADAITSSVRSNWTNRGLGTSDPAQLDEALQLYGGGQNLLAQRESQAGTVAGMNQSYYTAPALNLLQPGSTAAAQGQTLTSTGQAISGGAGPTLYPTSDLESLMNTTYNATAAANIANANNKAGQQSGLMSLFGSLGGGALSSGACM